MPASHSIIRFEAGVPASLREKIAPYADRVAEVMKGRRDDPWAYLAYLRKDWSASDDLVFSVTGESARELLREVKAATYSAGSWGEPDDEERAA